MGTSKVRWAPNLKNKKILQGIKNADSKIQQKNSPGITRKKDF